MFTRYLLFFGILMLTAAPAALSQAESSTAPIKWERFGIANRKISVMLPKLPTVVDSSNACAELERKTYYAYADQTVYEFVLAAKSRSKIPEWCREKHRFGETTVSSRLSELRSERSGNSEGSVRKFGREVFRFDNGPSTRWVVSDPENDRWIELAVHARGDKLGNEDKFLDSLDLAGSEGKNIGDGADSTLGDDVPAAAAEQKAAEAEASTKAGTADAVDALKVIGKPRAMYTDAARRANVAGSVRVKVALLANGSVGAITPVKELSHGLTEQAVAAARRIVFLPKRVNGTPVTVVQTIEYSFSIY